jgi:hypothetical protein
MIAGTKSIMYRAAAELKKTRIPAIDPDKRQADPIQASSR